MELSVDLQKPISIEKQRAKDADDICRHRRPLIPLRSKHNVYRLNNKLEISPSTALLYVQQIQIHPLVELVPMQLGDECIFHIPVRFTNITEMVLKKMCTSPANVDVRA